MSSPDQQPPLRLGQPGYPPPRLSQPDRPTAIVTPGGGTGGGARRLADLHDVDTTTAPVDVPVVWRHGTDGIWRAEPAAEDWSTPVQFSQDRPDPETAPRGALWVELGEQLRIHERR